MGKNILKYFICVAVCTCFCLILSMPKAMGFGKSLEKVSLSIQWLTQCQFAGYYVALDKGFYKEKGIDLTILPGATDINPIHMVSSDLADFGTKWLADFLAARENAPALISIAQILQSNGLIMVAKAASGIKAPGDFIGKRLGIWFFGNETQFFALMTQLDIPFDKLNIDALKWSIKPFLDGRFDVITAMTYNEYLRILDGGYEKEALNIIDFSEYGLNFPGQVIFTKSSILEKKPDLCERMVRASLQGWGYAMNHQEEAVDIIMKYDKTKSLKKDLQLRQMAAVTKLITYGNRPLGYHDPEQVQFVQNRLLEHKVISRPQVLSEVYTNQVWEKVHAGMEK